jgi:[ribosomal protein S5]-alanine N-acetyltransferase
MLHLGILRTKRYIENKMGIYKSFETERLMLKPTSEEDAVFIFELLNTPNWVRYIGDRNVKSVEEAKVYITKKMQPQLERLGYSNYTVIRKIDNVKLGTCGLFDREGIEGIDIGFAFLPEFEHRGYAFEAANKIIQACIEEFKLSQLKAITTNENIASQKLLKKLRMRFKRIMQLPNIEADFLLFDLPIETKMKN